MTTTTATSRTLSWFLHEQQSHAQISRFVFPQFCTLGKIEFVRKKSNDSDDVADKNSIKKQDSRNFGLI